MSVRVDKVRTHEQNRSRRAREDTRQLDLSWDSHTVRRQTCHTHATARVNPASWMSQQTHEVSGHIGRVIFRQEVLDVQPPICRIAIFILLRKVAYCAPFPRTGIFFNEAKRGCSEMSIKDNKHLRDRKGVGQSFSRNFGKNFFVYDMRQAESGREVSWDESVVQKRGGCQ